jgi:hypothetical protein
MKYVALFVGALGAALLWSGFLAPLILLAFGVPSRFSFFVFWSRNQDVSRVRSMWEFGARRWGISMFLYFTIFDYLDWKLFGTTYPHSMLHRIAVKFVTCFLIGAVVGFLYSPSKANKLE